MRSSLGVRFDEREDRGGKSPCPPIFRSGRLGEYSFRTEDELGVPELPDFRNVEPVQLALRRDAVPDGVLEHHVDREAEREDDAEQRGDAHELRRQLARVAVEESGDGTADAVPASAVVARSVREQTYRQGSPESVHAVDRDGANRIVHLQDVLDDGHGDAHEYARDEADDGRARRADESARRGYGDEAGEKAVP